MKSEVREPFGEVSKRENQIENADDKKPLDLIPSKAQKSTNLSPSHGGHYLPKTPDTMEITSPLRSSDTDKEQTPPTHCAHAEKSDSSLPKDQQNADTVSMSAPVTVSVRTAEIPPAPQSETLDNATPTRNASSQRGSITVDVNSTEEFEAPDHRWMLCTFGSLFKEKLARIEVTYRKKKLGFSVIPGPTGFYTFVKTVSADRNRRKGMQSRHLLYKINNEKVLKMTHINIIDKIKKSGLPLKLSFIDPRVAGLCLTTTKQHTRPCTSSRSSSTTPRRRIPTTTEPVPNLPHPPAVYKKTKPSPTSTLTGHALNEESLSMHNSTMGFDRASTLRETVSVFLTKQREDEEDDVSMVCDTFSERRDKTILGLMKRNMQIEEKNKILKNKFKRKCDNWNSERTVFENEKKAHAEEIKEYKTVISHFNAKMKRYTESKKLGKKACLLNAKDEMMESQKHEILHMRGEKERLLFEVQKLEHELQNEKNTVEDLKMQLKSTVGQEEQMKADFESTKKQILLLTEEFDRKSKKMRANYEHTLTELTAGLEQTQKDFTNEKQQLQEKAQKMLQNNKKLEKELLETVEKLKSLEAKNTKTREQLNACEQTIAHNLNENRNLTIKNSNILNEVKELEHKLEHVEINNSELERERDSEKTKNKSLTRQIKLLESEMTTVQNRNADLQTQIDFLDFETRKKAQAHSRIKSVFASKKDIDLSPRSKYVKRNNKSLVEEIDSNTLLEDGDSSVDYEKLVADHRILHQRLVYTVKELKPLMRKTGLKLNVKQDEKNGFIKFTKNLQLFVTQMAGSQQREKSLSSENKVLQRRLEKLQKNLQTTE